MSSYVSKDGKVGKVKMSNEGCEEEDEEAREEEGEALNRHPPKKVNTLRISRSVCYSLRISFRRRTGTLTTSQKATRRAYRLQTLTTSQKATRRAYRLQCCYDESLYLLLYIEAFNMDELLLVGRTNTKIDPFARTGS